MTRIPLTKDNLYDMICDLENTGPAEILEMALFQQILDDYQGMQNVHDGISTIRANVDLEHFQKQRDEELKELKEKVQKVRELANAPSDYMLKAGHSTIYELDSILNALKEILGS